MACARFVVSGHVQGVGFRAATRSEALRRGVRGHARNLRDGRVEVIAFGSDEALDMLERWLQHGPDGARVQGVEREMHAEQEFADFYTR